MLATARPTLTDGIAPGLGRMNNPRPADMKPDQAAGILKAPKIKIKFKGLVVVDKVITGADTGGQKARKRKLEHAAPAAQTVFAKKAPSSGMDSFVKPVMAVASEVEAMLGAPHAKLPAPRRASPTARHSAKAAAAGAGMLAAAAESKREVRERCLEQPSPSPAGRSAKKQRLNEPAAARQTVAPAAVSEPTPAAQMDRSQAVPAQNGPAPVQGMKKASAPAQAAAEQPQQQAIQPVRSSIAAAQQQQQQAEPGSAGPTDNSTVEQPNLAQPAQAAPKASQAVPKAQSAAGRDLPVVERARAELRAAVAEREREKAAQQEAARTQARRQASPQHQQQQQESASSGPQVQKNISAQGTSGPQKVPNEEKARWLAKIRSRRPTQEQKEAEEKQRIAEAAKREEERQQREAEEKACREAVERIEKLEETLKKYRATGVPEWLQQGVLFEKEERDEWVGVYKLAGRPWPAKYDIPGACCMPDSAGAAAAAAQPGPAGQPSKPDHKTASSLARRDSDMDIDEPALPELPKTSLHAAPESMLAVAQAAASGQSCGTHNGASPDVVNTSMGPPAQLRPSAAAARQAEACLSAAAAALEATHAAKDCRPSPGSSESETEGVNIPAPKLEEGELAGSRQSAPQKDQRSRKDIEWDRRESYERRSREYYPSKRYSSERRSREYSPDRARRDWRERSRDNERARRHRAASPGSRSRERDSSERYARSRPSYERPSHERDSRERRYSERSSRERSPSRARRDWRERSRSRSRCRDDERRRRDDERHQRRDDDRPRHAVAGSSGHEDPAELKAKMEALKASTQHDKRYVEVALAALQRRLVKALMAEHLQKKQSREADRARARPAAASTEAAQEVAPKQSAIAIPEKPNAAHNTAAPLPQGLPPPKLAPLPPVPVMPAAPACPQAPWPAQAPAPAPGGLPACYPPAQQGAAVGAFPAQYGQQWPQQPWGAAPVAQYPPGTPQYWQ